MAAPRIVVASHHVATRFVWDANCVDYCDRAEADLGAHVVAPDRPPGRLLQMAQYLTSLGLHLVNTAGAFIAPAEAPPCDVFIYMASLPIDLANLGALRGWKRAKTKVLILHEAWVAQMDRFKRLFDQLSDFDAVFAPMPFLPERLSERIGRPVTFLPRAIDALAQAPASLNAPRPIDVWSMGRRSPALHAQLFDAMMRDEITYLYDSFDSRMGWVKDSAGQRAQTRALLKRTSVLPVFGVKAFEHMKKDDAQTEDTVPLRYFEGAAAGCLMVGDPKPDTFPFEAVVPLAPDHPDVLRVLRDLLADQGRTAMLRRTCIVHALRNFDVAHRYRTIFEALDLPQPESLTHRLRLLDARAAEVEAEPVYDSLRVA